MRKIMGAVVLFMIGWYCDDCVVMIVNPTLGSPLMRKIMGAAVLFMIGGDFHPYF